MIRTLYLLVQKQSAQLPELLGYMSRGNWTAVAVVDLTENVLFEQPFEAHGKDLVKLSFWQKNQSSSFFVNRVDILRLLLAKTMVPSEITYLSWPLLSHIYVHLWGCW